VDIYGPRVYGAIRYFLRSYRESLPPDDALNIYQDMFLDLCNDNFRKLKTFRAGGRLATWLFTIARRQCLNHIRAITRKKRVSPTLTDKEILEIGQPLTDSGDPLAASENREAVLKALDRLDYENRLLLVLFYFEGLSYEEIAKVVGISENSVSAMLRKAREEIARILKR
jgi:RNA polymerase sigma-70 factor (ECF subfamily)